MTEQRPTLEKIAPTIDEAIEQGLADLGLSREAVDIEILDEGTKGLFGLGTRQARVLLTIKADVEPASKVTAVDLEESHPPASPVVSEPEVAEESSLSADEDQALQVAQDTVAELLEKMKVSAEVNASFIDDDDYNGRKPILVDIHGDDLSILIGRKAETLNALQYITSLIVGKELGRSVPLIGRC